MCVNLLSNGLFALLAIKIRSISPSGKIESREILALSARHII